MVELYDIIIIGGGPGGYVAAIRAAQLGLRIAIVEKESLGGVCLNWGCIPTKALLKSAQVFDYIKNAEVYGIKIDNTQINFSAIMSRSRSIATDMSRGVDFLMKKNKIEVIYGTATLRSSTTVSIKMRDNTSKEIYAKNIILATGARGRELPSMPIDNKFVLGYRDILALKTQPKSLIIVGAGAIGVEFAYFYNSIGTQVTLVECMSRIVPLEDEDVSKELAKEFSKQGIEVITSAEVTKVEIIENNCAVYLKNQNSTTQLNCDKVLSAVGIAPNIENLGLENLGIILEKNRVKVNEFYATNVKNIYAIGDIVHGPALAHVASAEGIICVEAIAGLNPEALNYNNLPLCTYCTPEIASVGYTEEASISAGYNIKVGKFPFSASGKAATAGSKQGFVKIIFDAQYGELLGAHIIGENATEMISEIVVARKLETTAHEILKSVHPHPTMSEAIIEAISAAYKQAIHL